MLTVGLALLGSGLVLYFAWRWRLGGAAAVVTADAERPDPQAMTITLSRDKLQSAQLRLGHCEIREIQEQRTVAAKIGYNESRHLLIKAPTDAVVIDVWVTPTQRVQQGDALLRLSSREIGLVRDAIAQSQADVQLARRAAERASTIDANLAELLRWLAGNPPLSDVERPFADKVLGEYRQTILTAYSKLLLASAIMSDTKRLEPEGGLSGRTVQERRSQLEIAKAAFSTACEQSRFDSAQEVAKAAAAREHAERLLAIHCRRLEALGGHCDMPEDAAANALSELTLRAPFEGIIDERLTLPAANVAAGQTLLVLSNPDVLWITAEVPERDWNSLASSARETLEFQVPSLANSQTKARVRFTEPAISSETLTLTIVAEFDNAEHRFRPGMFAWAALPTARPRAALMAPASAIVNHEQAKYVFVAGKEGTFHAVAVTTGAQSGDWIEVVSGVTDAEPIAVEGAFLLKSEWLLEAADTE